jgi:hypothetical protein
MESDYRIKFYHKPLPAYPHAPNGYWHLEALYKNQLFFMACHIDRDVIAEDYERMQEWDCESNGDQHGTVEK